MLTRFLNALSRLPRILRGHDERVPLAVTLTDSGEVEIISRTTRGDGQMEAVTAYPLKCEACGDHCNPPFNARHVLTIKGGFLTKRLPAMVSMPCPHCGTTVSFDVYRHERQDVGMQLVSKRRLAGGQTLRSYRHAQVA